MTELKLKPNYHDFCFRITDIYIYVMLFAFPLFTGFEGYSNVTVSKYIFLAAVTALWFIALLAFGLASRKLFCKRKISLAGGLVLLYVLLCCVSAVFSPYKVSVLLGEGRFDGIITIILSFLIFIGISEFARPKLSYFYAAAAAVTLNCIVGIFQILGFNPLHLFPGTYDFYDAGIKFTSTFLGTIGNADLFSAYICLVLPLVCVHYITAVKRPPEFLPVILICAFSLFYCGVSGGMLAFAVTALVAAPLVVSSGERLRRALEIAFVVSIAVFFAASFKASDSGTGVTVAFSLSHYSAASVLLATLAAILRLMLRKSEFIEKPLRVFFCALSAAAVVCGFVTAYFWTGTEGTIYELSRVLHGKVSDSFGSSRILIWRKTLALVPERLLIGGGPGTLALRLDVEFTRFVKETGATLSSTVDNAHNAYLGILINTGLLSLAAYLSAQGVALFKAMKAAKAEMLCLACGLLCYWMQDFFGLALFIVSPMMWVFWGLLVSGLRNREN